MGQKSQDLIDHVPSGSFREFGNQTKPDSRIKGLQLELGEKQKELKGRRLDKKVLAHLSPERCNKIRLRISKAFEKALTSSSEVESYNINMSQIK